ncbi:MAG: MATE family efflux transporter [Lachnospiraceae bacterium]|nr:MATE family efflux transporter [Lachnospiraceae bacterium]
MSQVKDTKVLFDRNRLIRLVVPLMMEQLLSVTVGMVDMIMASGAGEAAVSGISLVNSICVLLIMMFSAMATGGSVVGAQFLGSGDKETACRAADQLMTICLLIALVIFGGSFLGNRHILKMIYGSVESDVMENAVTYFAITSVSFPFLAVYNAGAALFRVMGNSKISMKTSFLMNGINIAGNAILVYGFHMGVSGVAYATLISRITASVVILYLIHQKKYEIHITHYLNFKLDFEMLKKIFSIGIPQALENCMFQIGKLITQSLIASFGTASIAANACAMTVEQLAFMPGSAMGLAMTTVVGQCAGAGDYRQAREYAKKLIGTAYLFLWILNGVILFAAPFVAHAYNLSEASYQMAVQVIRYHSICCMAIWPMAFTLPNTLRAAGDARYTLTVGVTSMWCVRIAMAYFLGSYLNVGLLGVWIAQTLDWVVRAFFYIIRFRGHKWEEKSVVRNNSKPMLAKE